MNQNTAIAVAEKRYVGQVIQCEDWDPDEVYDPPWDGTYIVTAVDVASDVLVAAAEAEYRTQPIYDSPLTKAGKPRVALGYGKTPKPTAIEIANRAVHGLALSLGVEFDEYIDIFATNLRTQVGKDFDPEVREAIVTILKASQDALGALIEEVTS